MRQNDRDVDQKAANGNRKKPRETMSMRTAAGQNLKHAAADDKHGRAHQNPDFVGVEERVEGFEHAGHKGGPGGEARDGRRSHRQRREATAQRVKADQRRMGDVRPLAGLRAVML